MTTLHLVRHGQTLFNAQRRLQGWCDSPLTPLGKAQAMCIGRRLAHTRIDAVFTSDLTRARETAQIMLVERSRRPPITALTGLREWHFGGFEGLSNDSLWGPLYAEFGYEYGQPGARDAIYSEGESRVIDTIARLDTAHTAENALSVHTRTQKAVDHILGGAHPAVDTVIVIVTHGAVMRSLINVIAPGNTLKEPCPNAGIVTVEVIGESTVVHAAEPPCTHPEHR